MAAKKPWYAVLGPAISVMIGLFTLGGFLVNFLIADARQADRVERVEESITDHDARLDSQESAIEDTQTQYQLIQQTLGQMADTLKDIKAQQIPKRER